MVKVRPDEGSEGSSRKEIVHGSGVCFIYITYGENKVRKNFKLLLDSGVHANGQGYHLMKWESLREGTNFACSDLLR